MTYLRIQVLGQRHIAGFRRGSRSPSVDDGYTKGFHTHRFLYVGYEPHENILLF